MHTAGFPEHHRKVISHWPTPFVEGQKWQFEFEIHGVPLKITTGNRQLFGELEDFFPNSWKKSHKSPINIFWRTPESFKFLDPNLWDEIENPDCNFSDNFISQRDFLARKVEEKSYELISFEKIDDGFFNFLRALLPVYLLQQGKILFHSSCVVDEKNQAYLFFGPSGAGKTTISELCEHSGGLVLGDDMNILCSTEEGLFVEPAAVGQRYFHKEHFGKTFPLKSAFWLEKGSDFQATSLKEGRKVILLSSFANLFWDQLESGNYLKLFKTLDQIQKQVSLSKLIFKKDRRVWEYVQKY